MSIKNKRIYSLNQQTLIDLKIEYTLLGFETLLEDGCLTVFARKIKEHRHEPRKKRRNRN